MRHHSRTIVQWGSLAPAFAAWILAVALALALTNVPAARAAAGVVPDGARETRWAEEIVPQLMVGDPVWLATPHRARVLALYAVPQAKPKGAVMLVHGLGVNPDFGMIGQLRMILTDRGFATLSVQMPVLAADAPRQQYDDLAPYAAERLDAALAWLRARGYARIAVVSHSMGAQMVDGWLARHASAPLDAWVPVGMQIDFTRAPQLPVLDVVAAHELPGAVATAPKRRTELPHDRCSRSVTIPGTDHYMEDGAPHLADAVVPFLTEAFAGRCRTSS